MYRQMLIFTLAILVQIPEHTCRTPVKRNAEARMPLGCWKDNIPRALPSLEGKSSILNEHYTRRVNPIQKCHDAAVEKGYTIFAIQDGGQCFSSDDAKSKYMAMKYGPSNACASDGEGGPMANSVYEINANCVWSAYGEWGECNGVCVGTGTRNRTRTVTTPASGNGAECAGLATEMEVCDTKVGPELCQFRNGFIIGTAYKISAPIPEKECACLVKKMKPDANGAEARNSGCWAAYGNKDGGSKDYSTNFSERRYCFFLPSGDNRS